MESIASGVPSGETRLDKPEQPSCSPVLYTWFLDPGSRFLA
jgi:hypothetical protein